MITFFIRYTEPFETKNKFENIFVTQMSNPCVRCLKAEGSLLGLQHLMQIERKTPINHSGNDRVLGEPKRTQR